MRRIRSSCQRIPHLLIACGLSALLVCIAGCPAKKPPAKKIPQGKSRVEAPHKEVIRPAETQAMPASAGTPQNAASQRLITSGVSALDQKNLELAALRFQDAVNVDPRNWAAYYYLALVDYRLGKKDVALGLLDKAATLVGGDKEGLTRIETLRSSILNNEDPLKVQPI